MKLVRQQTLQESSVPPQAISDPVPAASQSLWSEIKITNKNIARRSYHSAITDGPYLYVYGGYDINSGIMADFYRLNLQEDHSQAKWEALSCEGKDCPGPRYCHTSVTDGTHMYLFAGKIDSLNNTNQLSVYDLKTNQWMKTPAGFDLASVPKIDSHSAVIAGRKMFVFGGFLGGKIGKYSNTLYELDLDTYAWKEVKTTGVMPAPRANSSIVLHNQESLYLFGGSNLDQKFGDLWKLNIKTLQWEELTFKPEHAPDSRDGHTLVSISPTKLLLFGGIHDITHQRNDIYIFDTTARQWQLIENDEQSEPAAEQPGEAVENTLTSSLHHHHNHKKIEVEGSEKERGRIRYRQLKESNYHASSPGQVHAQKEQKSKQDIKKLQLLSEFELTTEQRERYRNPSPTLESLKSSIKAINGNSNGAKKKANNQNGSGINGSTTLSAGTSLGASSVNSTAWINIAQLKKNQKKKPCARDGHSANLFNKNTIVIFGGDRHIMSFNDMFLFNLDKFIS